MREEKEEISIEVKGSQGVFTAIWNGSTTECRGCGEPIGFAKTKKGRWVPFNPSDTDGDPVEPHWGTCPNAKDFKK